MSDDRAFEDRSITGRRAVRPQLRNVLGAPASRVFASGLFLASIGVALWASGEMAGMWSYRMIGVCLLALGCLTATGALLAAEP